MFAGTSTNQLDNRYLLHEVIGQGGMGIVYRATDRLTSRSIALKRVMTQARTLNIDDSRDLMDFRLSLAREFKLSASLRHPHIVKVFDYGFNVDQQPYYTMELLEAPQTLTDAGRQVSVPERITFLLQTLQALAYLHRRGIIHRDLKPANILVVDGVVKILDFGLSTMYQRNILTEEPTSRTVGTLAYMPPEVLAGGNNSIPSDLYAIGIIAYEMLMGAHPFDVENPTQLIDDIIHQMPDVTVLPVNEDVAPIIYRLLQKEAADRYQSADDVFVDLLQATQQPHQESADIRESYLQAARLIGRESELEALSIALNQVARGSGEAWLVSGESGVGKSRLLDEVRTLALVKGTLVLRGQAMSIGGGPYQIWQSVLRWLCLVDELQDDEIALLKVFIHDVDRLILRDVSHIKPTGDPPSTLQDRLLALMLRVLRRYQRPVLILFDDLQWVGSGSIGLLEQFVQALGNLSVLVIGSYRSDEYADLQSLPDYMQLIELHRLDPHEIEALSAAMLGNSGHSPEVVDLLRRETEGNVLFIIEVVRSLAEEIGQLDQIGRMTLPASVFTGGVQRVIARRLERLTAKSRSVLQIAAVMGRQLDLAMLNILAPDVDLQAWLEDCSDASVLEVEDDVWRFTHEKMREGLLNMLTLVDLKELHQRVAETIEQQHSDLTPHFATLAHHWRVAGGVAQEEKYATYAGEQSLQQGAYREALAYLERAQTLVVASDDYSEQRKQRKQVHLNQRMAEAKLGIGSYDEAWTLFKNSFELCQALDDEIGVAVSMSHMGRVAFAQDEFEVAYDLYDHSLTIFRKLGNQAGIARTLNRLGDVLYEMDRHDEAKQLYQESMQLSREIGADWGMAGASRTQEIVQPKQLTDYTEMQQTFEQAIQSSQSLDDHQGLADALFNLAVLTEERGDIDEAVQHLRKALTYFRHLDDAVGKAKTLEYLGKIATDSKNYEAAEHYLRQSVKASLQSGLELLSLNTLLRISHLLIARQQFAHSIEILAFLLYHPESSESIQDEVERTLFQLGNRVTPEQSAASWETGKTITFEAMTALWLPRI